MAHLPPELRTIMDRAAVSLAAWQVFEALVEGPQPREDLPTSTGLDVDAAEQGLAALAARGLVTDHAGQLALAEPHVADARRLCLHVRANTALRQEALALAARRERSAGLITVRISWAPELSAPSELHSLASNVPARPAPSRSGGPAAPAT